MVTTAVYAGSFDPITRGHEDLIRRSCEFVDHLIVAVAINSAKKALFTVEERVELIRLSTADQRCVEVTQFEGLLVDFAKKVGASLNIRGLRAVSDFEYEFQMALMNRHMSESFETVFMVPSVETTYISSSVVREVAQHHGNLEGLVHPAVAKALANKFGRDKPSSPSAKFGRNNPSSSSAKVGRDKPSSPSAKVGRDKPSSPSAKVGPDKPSSPSAKLGPDKPSSRTKAAAKGSAKRG